MNSYKNPYPNGHGLTIDNIDPSLEAILLDGSLGHALRSRHIKSKMDNAVTNAGALSVNIERAYMDVVESHMNDFREGLQNSLLAHFIRTIGAGGKGARGRHLRYVENFILMSLVPFGAMQFTI